MVRLVHIATIYIRNALMGQPTSVEYKTSRNNGWHTDNAKYQANKY